MTRLCEQKLTPDELALFLENTDWHHSIADHNIVKQFDFADFEAAMVYVLAVAGIAIADDHHPDIHLEDYRYVTIVLTSHACKSISHADINMSRRLDDMYIACQAQ